MAERRLDVPRPAFALLQTRGKQIDQLGADLIGAALRVPALGGAGAADQGGDAQGEATGPQSPPAAQDPKADQGEASKPLAKPCQVCATRKLATMSATRSPLRALSRWSTTPVGKPLKLTLGLEK